MANVASRRNPRIAKVTTTAPTARTTSTNRKSVGYQLSWAGMPKGIRIADAETVIMQPAMIEYSRALITL